MTGDDHRRILDAYLQGAHLALLAVEGKLRERGHLDEDAIDEVLAELHEMFGAARDRLDVDGSVRTPEVGSVVPFPVGSN